MNTVPQDAGWEERLKSGLGDAPAPDFDAWRQRQSDAVHCLNPIVTAHARRKRRILMSSLKLAAASLLLAIGLVWFRSGGTFSSLVFAETITGVDDVQTMTWTTTYYKRVTSADGRRTWLKPERRLHAYRHPGHYRETDLDEEGNALSVRIIDVRAGRELWLNPKQKKAVLKMPAAHLPDVQGPFGWVGVLLRDKMMGGNLRVKSIELLGEKPTAEGKANVFRATIHKVGDGVYFDGDNRAHFSIDVWIDTVSKQLVAIHFPGADIFDPLTAADRNNPAEKEWSKVTVPGSIEHEIVLSAKLDPALFSLDPPKGFQFEAIARPTVTEEEMIEYLGAAARFNGGVFPDSPYGLAVDRQAFNAASQKAEKDRTEAEQKLIELHDKFLLRELNKLPVRHFEEDHTVAKSFCYVGTGVKLGQSERIVCWYQLKNATKYRAVYGDLSVKDVAPADLPLSTDH